MKRRSNSLAIGVAVVLIFLLSSSPAAAEIVTFIPISDAVIRSDSPYENFSYVSLRVKREASTGLRSWSYVQFDLSSIPPNSRIDSAVLSLYAWWAIPPENFPVSVFRCTESWSDSSITYANKPASNSDPAGESIFASTLSVYQNIDITGLSRDPKVVEAYKNDPLVHPMISGKTGIEIVRQGEWLIANANRLHHPMLLMSGSEDRLCSIDGVKEFAANAPKGLVTLKIWKGLYHEIHNEPEKAEVFKFTVDWIFKHLK